MSRRIIAGLAWLLLPASAGETLAQRPWRMPPAEPPREAPADDNKPPADKSAPKPEPEEKSRESTPSTDQPTSTASADEPVVDEDPAKVELYIPSVTRLGRGFQASRAADLQRAMVGILNLRPPDETTDGFDVAGAMRLLDQVLGWPDTSVSAAIYPQDKEGRACWAVDVDWPLKDLLSRLRALLDDEAARTILKDISLVDEAPGRHVLQSADTVLAVFEEHAGAARICSATGVAVPRSLFGRPKADDGRKGPSQLIYSRLNFDAGEDDDGGMFGGFQFFKDIRYSAAVDRDGLWNDRFSLRWSGLIGLGAKAAVGKVKHPFESPSRSLITAAIGVDLGGLLDMMSGIENGLLASHVRQDVACSVLPGSGFVPFPDLCFQTRVARRERLVDDLREYIEEQNTKRAEDDLAPLWHEEAVDDDLLFWSAGDDAGYGLQAVTYRAVLLFEGAAAAEREKAAEENDADDDRSDDDSDKSASPVADESDDSATTATAESQPAASAPAGKAASTSKSAAEADDGADAEPVYDTLLVLRTASSARQAVRHWKQQTASAARREKTPSTDKAHWQVRVHWRAIYEYARPYLTLMARAAEGRPPPTAAELSSALADAAIDVRIEFTGFQARHTGPLPLGAMYVPIVVADALMTTADPSSETAREQEACRHLRILHHHAKLFRRDYGRWPATVAELDGYVDFSSHPYLLYIRPPDRGIVVGVFGMVSGKPQSREADVLTDEPDDSLYEIDWSEDAWLLKFRPHEFRNWKTIGIDSQGEIRREPLEKKKELADGAAPRPDRTSEERELASAP